jgi:hypothetical protein
MLNLLPALLLLLMQAPGIAIDSGATPWQAAVRTQSVGDDPQARSSTKAVCASWLRWCAVLALLAEGPDQTKPVEAQAGGSAPIPDPNLADLQAGFLTQGRMRDGPFFV